MYQIGVKVLSFTIVQLVVSRDEPNINARKDIIKMLTLIFALVNKRSKPKVRAGIMCLGVNFKIIAFIYHSFTSSCSGDDLWLCSGLLPGRH